MENINTAQNPVEEVALLRITVVGEEKQTKDKSKKFWTYKAITKNGAMVDLKFRQEVGNIPKESKFIIVVHPDSINQARNTYYPTWWVARVEAFESWSANLIANRQRVAEVFGEASDPSEE